MTLNLSPILKVWAADSSNVSSLTQGQIGAGIVLNSSVVSDDPNAALQIAYEAAQYLQQTAGLYSALIPYAYPAQATIIQYVNSEYFVRRFIRLTSNPTSTTNNPPITGASIVTTNGIDVYSGGTDNTDWVEITSKLINALTVNGGTIDNTVIGETTPSTGRFTTVLAGTDANFTDFPAAHAVISNGNTGKSDSAISALVLEAISNGTTPAVALNLFGTSKGAEIGYALQAQAFVNAPSDTANAMAIIGQSNQTHPGGDNYAFYADALGGVRSYSFYGNRGKFYNGDEAIFGGAISAASVSTGDVALKWKVLTGNLNTTSPNNIAHGVGANIVGVSGGVVSSKNSNYCQEEPFSGSAGLTIQYNSTNIVIGFASDYNSQAYKIIVWYQ